MSRIGKKPVAVGDAKVSIDGKTVTVEGKLGKLTRELRPEISAALEDAKSL